MPARNNRDSAGPKPEPAKNTHDPIYIPAFRKAK
jgi:hypothetical protein